MQDYETPSALPRLGIPDPTPSASPVPGGPGDSLPGRRRGDEAAVRSPFKVTRRGDAFKLAGSLPSAVLQMPVCDLHLTTRCRNVFHANGIRVLGDLKKHTMGDALRWPNFGIKTAEQLAATLRSQVGLAHSPQTAQQRQFRSTPKTLLESVVAALDQLHARDRLICRSRLGLEGDRKTLAELAVLCSLSRERVRQLQARIFASLQRDHSWPGMVASRLETTLGPGRMTLPLEDLETADHWFASLQKESEVLKYLLLVFAANRFCLTVISSQVVISRIETSGTSEQARTIVHGASPQLSSWAGEAFCQPPFPRAALTQG